MKPMTASAMRPVVLALCVLAGLAPLAARAAAPEDLQLPANARVGVVSVLDPEVTHFHAARQLQASFLKTYTVAWSTEAMLTDALRARLTQLGVTGVPVRASEALMRAREACFLNANLAKGLSKECAAPYAQLALQERLDALIVLGPGLNDGTHAGGTRRKDLPEYLRGWCLVTGEEGAVSPTLLNLTELLLIGVPPSGPALAAREWGGSASGKWVGFAAPSDLKALPATQLEQLRPLYQGMLEGQGGSLLNHLHVAR
jgi:hypothetical protein